MMAALYNGSVFDRVLSSSTLAAISFPEFFVASILILVFAVGLGWFPTVVRRYRVSEGSLDTEWVFNTGSAAIGARRVRYCPSFTGQSGAASAQGGTR